MFKLLLLKFFENVWFVFFGLNYKLFVFYNKPKLCIRNFKFFFSIKKKLLSAVRFHLLLQIKRLYFCCLFFLNAFIILIKCFCFVICFLSFLVGVFFLIISFSRLLFFYFFFHFLINANHFNFNTFCFGFLNFNLLVFLKRKIYFKCLYFCYKFYIKVSIFLFLNYWNVIFIVWSFKFKKFSFLNFWATCVLKIKSFYFLVFLFASKLRFFFENVLFLNYLFCFWFFFNSKSNFLAFYTKFYIFFLYFFLKFFSFSISSIVLGALFLIKFLRFWWLACWWEMFNYSWLHKSFLFVPVKVFSFFYRCLNVFFYFVFFFSRALWFWLYFIQKGLCFYCFFFLKLFLKLLILVSFFKFFLLKVFFVFFNLKIFVFLYV